MSPGGSSMDCTYLQFHDSDPTNYGYHNATANSWGGNPVYNPDDKLWHVFTAMFSDGCPVDSWKTNSFVFHATSPNPMGPWTGSDVAINIFAHNPQALLHPDGTWLLYFIGGWHMPFDSRQNCSAEGTPTYPPQPEGPGMNRTDDGCGPPPYNGGCGIRFAHSRSPYGPWTLQDIEVSNLDPEIVVDCAKTNPAPMLMKNGSIAMAYNGGYCKKVETIAVMMAESWQTPFKILTQKSIAPDLSAEDPTLWETERGFHILGHKLGMTRSMYAASTDLYNWNVSYAHDQTTSEAYSKVFAFSNGTEVTTDRTERPIMLMNTTTGKPWMLTSAVQVGGSMWGWYRTVKN